MSCFPFTLLGFEPPFNEVRTDDDFRATVMKNVERRVRTLPYGDAPDYSWAMHVELALMAEALGCPFEEWR